MKATGINLTFFSQNLSLEGLEQLNNANNSNANNTNIADDTKKIENIPGENKSTAGSDKPALPKVLNIYKPISKTPLEVVQALQQQYPEYSQIDPDTGRQLKIGKIFNLIIF